MEISIVVVEDELIAKMDLLRLINWEAHGCHIVGEAHNGREAILLIERMCPDLVITDVRMPVLNGIEMIKHFQTAEYKPEFVILSGFDDYALVRQGLVLGALDYLLKLDLSAQKLLDTIEKVKKIFSAKESNKAKQSQQEMTERQLLRNINDLRKNFFTDIIKGVSQTDLTREEEMRFLDIRLDPGMVCCLILRAGEAQNFENISFEQTVNLNQAVRGIMEDILSEEHYVYLFEGRFSEFIVFASPHEESKDELSCLLKTTERVAEMLQIYLNLSVKIGVGCSKNEEKMLESAYKRAEKVLENHFFKSDQSVILWDHMPEFSERDAETSRGICQPYDISIAYAKEYISRHFHRQISLSEVASMSGFNPSYFSTLFKKYVNMSFSEYVNFVRIEHAKKLLLQTGNKAYEVAGLCGYKDAAHFFRTFKKMTGQSPREYNKRKRQF